MQRLRGKLAAMLPEGNQGRIVLVSDGNETDGSVEAALDSLKRLGGPKTVVFISTGIATDRGL